MDKSTCTIQGCDTRIRAKGMCASHYARMSRYGDPEYVTPRQARINAIIAAGEMACSKCREVKRLDQFASDSTRPIGVRPACKACVSPAVKAWRDANPEKMAASTASWRLRNAEAHKAYMGDYLAQWKSANKAKVQEYSNRRRALKAKAPLGAVDLDALWASSGEKCALCSEPLSRSTAWPDPKFASVDHIIPLSKGGAHAQDNLQYACLSCNLQKHAKVL